MEERYEIFEMLDRYNDGLVSVAEKIKIEEKLLKDSMWQEEWALLQGMVYTIQEAGESEMREKFQAWREPRLDSTSPAKASIRFLTSHRIAAGIAILAGLGLAICLYALFAKDSPDSQLFAQHFGPAPGLPIKSGKTEWYRNANQFYRDGDYSESAKIYGKLSRTHEYAMNDTVLFYLGAAELANGNSGKAISPFNTVLSMSLSDFRQRTEWYLSLAYLSEGDRGSARKTLKIILGESRHLYKSEALQLLSDMDQLE